MTGIVDSIKHVQKLYTYFLIASEYHLIQYGKVHDSNFKQMTCESEGVAYPIQTILELYDDHEKKSFDGYYIVRVYRYDNEKGINGVPLDKFHEFIEKNKSYEIHNGLWKVQTKTMMTLEESTKGSVPFGYSTEITI